MAIDEADRKDIMRPQTYRTIAKVVGAMYLGGFVVGLSGSGLIQSVLGSPDEPAQLAAIPANSMKLAVGAILWLMAVAGDAAHGVLMFPILKQHSERVALGYLGSRIIDAVFIAIMVLFVLLQISLGSAHLKTMTPDTAYLQGLSSVFMHGQLYAYNMGMITLGISGLMLCYTLYRARLLPRFLAVWGLAGYAIIFLGMVSEVMGSGLGLVSSIPGGLWEAFVGVWLIAKGFNVSGLAPLSNDAPEIGSPR